MPKEQSTELNSFGRCCGQEVNSAELSDRDRRDRRLSRRCFVPSVEALFCLRCAIRKTPKMKTKTKGLSDCAIATYVVEVALYIYMTVQREPWANPYRGCTPQTTRNQPCR